MKTSTYLFSQLIQIFNIIQNKYFGNKQVLAYVRVRK